MVHVVAYDLHNPGRDYTKIEGVLKSADGGWAHPQGSVWFIDTLDQASTWVDRLRAVGDANDEYFVGRMQRSWSSWNMDKEVVDWLNDGRRRW
jgi:hypothetical protein